MADAEHQKLLKLYELSINEEHHFLDAHQNRVAFYCGILSALFAGTVAGFFQASEWHHKAFLCIGPVLICALSAIAIKGTSRLYQRFLEAVTIRAKIEQELGLTKVPSVKTNVTDPYWQSEPITPPRHLKERKKFESSEIFIKKHKTRGYQLWTICWFWCFLVIGVLMLVGIWILG